MVVCPRRVRPPEWWCVPGMPGMCARMEVCPRRVLFDAYVASGKGNNKIKGMAYVVFGQSGQISPILEIGSLDGSNGFVIQGNSADTCRDCFFSSRAAVSTGDLNGDGVDDIILGWDQAEPDSTGKAYVVFGRNTSVEGPFSNVVSLGSLDGQNGFIVHGVGPDDHAGFALSAAGDLNHDGVNDLVLGAPRADTPGGQDAGATYVVFGRDYNSSLPFPVHFQLSSLDGTIGFVIEGVNAGDSSGQGVHSDGDINGDGISDLTISARFADPDPLRADAGQVYILFGRDYNTESPFPTRYPLSGLLPGSGGDGTRGFVVNGISANDHLYWTSLGGDLNGDGLNDLALAGTRVDVAGEADAGEAYVLFGKSTGYDAVVELSGLAAGDGSTGFAIPGLAAGDNTGASIMLAGDINGDARDDLLLAAPWSDPAGRADAGAIYLVYGRSATTGFGSVLDLHALSSSQGMIFQGAATRSHAGNGLLMSAPLFSSGAGIAVGDLNGDGTLDVAMADSEYDNVVFGRNFSQPGWTVSPRTGLTTSEGGAMALLSVVLDQPPTDNVTVEVTSLDSSEGRVAVGVSPSSVSVSLVFTAADWDQPQEIAIIGQDDNEPDGDVLYSVQVAVSPLTVAVEYLSVNPDEVVVRNLDDGLDGVSSKFFVVDADDDRTFQYGATGTSVTNTALAPGNTDPRGSASNAAGDTIWVVDANDTVFVYDATGNLLSSWTAAGINTAEGITTDGIHIWIVDGKSKLVHRYDNAATTLTPDPHPDFTFALDDYVPTNAKGITTDGTTIWIVAEHRGDLVLKYRVDGEYLAGQRWYLDSSNANPTGITLDPTQPDSSNLWIVDNGADAVFEYDRDGLLQGSFPLTSANSNPQGIADPPPQVTAPANEPGNFRLPVRPAEIVSQRGFKQRPRITVLATDIAGERVEPSPAVSATAMESPWHGVADVDQLLRRRSLNDYTVDERKRRLPTFTVNRQTANLPNPPKSWQDQFSQASILPAG